VIVASVVLANLSYLIGAAVLAVIGVLIVLLRHRKPKSVEANMASFNRGLRALAPGARPAAKRGGRSVREPVDTRPPPPRSRVEPRLYAAARVPAVEPELIPPSQPEVETG
jgi:hypothetical protein